MPTPTQVNTEDIADLKSATMRLVDALHTLELTVTKEFGDVRGEIRELRSDVRSAIRVAAWGIGIITPIVIALVGFAFWAAFRAGEVNVRLNQIEQRIEAKAPK